MRRKIADKVFVPKKKIGKIQGQYMQASNAQLQIKTAVWSCNM
jgi:hypothetical protein